MPESEPSDPTGGAAPAKGRLSDRAPPKPKRRSTSSIPPALVTTKTAARIAPAPPRPPRPLARESQSQEAAEPGAATVTSAETNTERRSKPTASDKAPRSRRAPAATPSKATQKKKPARLSPLLLLLGVGALGGVAWYSQKPATSKASGPGPAIAANTAEPQKQAEPSEEGIRTIDLDEPEPGTEAQPNAGKTDRVAHAKELAQPGSGDRASSQDALAVPTPGGDPAAPGDGTSEASAPPANDDVAKPTQPASAPARAVESAKPAVDAPALPPFDAQAAKTALTNSAAQASSCRRGDDPKGTAEVLVTFSPSGRVTSANVNGPPFGGTPTGGCIAATLRQASVAPFSGNYVTVRKLVNVR